MIGFILVASSLLSCLFLVSGTAKLCDLQRTGSGLREFGVPVATPILAIVLGAGELIVGLLLLAASSQEYGAVCATGLTLLFAAGISWNLLRGHRPACGCFGPLVITQIGWSSLTRSVILVALSVGLLAADRVKPDRGADRLLSVTYGMPIWGARVILFASVVIVCLATILAVVVIWLRGERLAVRQLESTIGPLGVPGKRGIAARAPVPGFALPDLAGRKWELAEFLAIGKPILLMFLSPACSSCRSLAGDVAEWQLEHSRFITIVVISEGKSSENEKALGKLKISHVLLQDGRTIRDLYGCPATPGALAITPDGLAASPMTMGAHAIHELWLKLVREAQSKIAVAVETSVGVRK